MVASDSHIGALQPQPLSQSLGPLHERDFLPLSASPPGIRVKFLVGRCDGADFHAASHFAFCPAENPERAACVIVTGYKQDAMHVTTVQFREDGPSFLLCGTGIVGKGNEP